MEPEKTSFPFRNALRNPSTNLARKTELSTFTGKKKVIKIGGAYHGWSDQVVYGLRIPGTGSLEAVGIPAGALSATSEILPGDLDTLRDLMQEDATWHQPGKTAIAGDYIGRDRVFEYFGKIFELSGGTFKGEIFTDVSLEKGATSNEYVLWSEAKGGTYIPTPVAYDGGVYVLYDKGIIGRFDARTGERRPYGS